MGIVACARGGAGAASAASGGAAAAPEVCRWRAEAGAMRLDRRQAIEPRRHRACGAAGGRPADGVPRYLDDHGGMAPGGGHEVSHWNVAPRSAQSAELGGTRRVMRMMPPHSGQAGASLRSGKLSPLSV